ncbi:ABC transporter substrate-binding protein [Paenibacillus alvei]|uniref:ABC transporter substrate-binding protein n=1 Tax=Paenibacillus alvei TaxID=44250 RepID=UPI000289D9B8|nr:ABC transporter substrate-binding protein [Paenibacillus alvei]EJW16043.1 ferrichrome-binding protein [Paenibacillus alvei DSM 29]MCY7482869.1 ABC transporter substrate-binding protein [Paenibacillus alvei]MCY9541252.1 ABC transporter substrate-binding protein [Paenibacillus alvei]MCY9704605.1 ABC transporter substrate-binding protein [Paenibacillus alvei]MCY9732735.1 ABC transporter substrate-binding protein [Paenibacillus alvei]
MIGGTWKKSAWLIVLVAAVLGLSACGSTGAPQTKKESSTAAEATDHSTAKSEAETKDTDTRVVKDEFGKVSIPANPKRVMGVYLQDYMTALGVRPVMQWYHPSWGKQDYLGLDVPAFDITGSMEALLAASPDLIIVDGGVDAAKYAQYSRIAPTYRLQEGILQNPLEILKKVADLLNMKEKGDSVLAQCNQKITETKDKLQKAVGNETVTVIRLNVGDKTLALFGIENRYIGSIYKEMGLTPHPLARDMKEFNAILSEEKLPDLNAHHIIVFPSNGTWSSEENKEAEKLLDSTLWKGLPAVQNHCVHEVDFLTWMN